MVVCELFNTIIPYLDKSVAGLLQSFFQLVEFKTDRYSDFDIQSISQTDLKVLSKIFEFDYDPSSGDSPTVGAFPNAIEQLYDEHPDIYDDENNEDDYEEEY